MIGGDCNVCINGKLPPYSATCVECGLSRKNYKPITNADKLRTLGDEELAELLTDDLCELLCGAPLVCEGQCKQKMLDWLRQEEQG